jgi:hypothetical protein
MTAQYWTRLGKELNQQRREMSANTKKQSSINTVLPPSEAELEWVMSNPDAKAGATTVINMLRWHCHMEQLAVLP